MSTTGSTSVITSSPNALPLLLRCTTPFTHPKFSGFAIKGPTQCFHRFMDPLLKKEAAPLKVYCTLEDFLPVIFPLSHIFTGQYGTKAMLYNMLVLLCDAGYYSTEDRSWTTMSGCPDFTKPWSPGLEDECMAFLNNIVLKVYSALPSRATASLRWWIAANSIRSVEDGGGKWRPDLVLMSASSDNPTNPKALPPAKWRSVHALAELKDREKNSPQEDNGEEASGLDMLIDDEHMEEAIGEVLQELQEDLFSFIPIAHSDIIDDGENAAGPSLHQNSIVLDDNEDECMEVEHPTAGKVISMDETLHQRWRRESIAAGRDGQDVEMGEASDPKFFSFASETDWRVACWAIQDGQGEAGAFLP
ncbi:hypothetical protein SERLA73DRAFT_75388 [Serpula lacrymans var. lacrymans S7.3]|uniref:Uncharacterized protein n=1 Tax=Serpula lacrymans var. lacrymans (strain S7.3) TaxID=936435 RepID=F8Q3I4_SERL3|nr:hypothetical protein SERLA73DRAFT_75388 [Serpula lacrymans var. lacrymans S7.3]